MIFNYTSAIHYRKQIHPQQHTKNKKTNRAKTYHNLSWPYFDLLDTFTYM